MYIYIHTVFHFELSQANTFRMAYAVDESDKNVTCIKIYSRNVFLGGLL